MLDSLRKLHPRWVTQRIRATKKVKSARDANCKDPLSLELYGQNILIRPLGPDFRVATASMGNEFNPLIGVLEEGFDGLIIDAGGFIGTAAIRLSQIFPKATIITIEPSEQNFEILQQNIAAFSNIHSIKAALVPEGIESATLFDRETGDWGFTIVEQPKDKSDPKSLHQVETVTLSQILAKHENKDIGLVKLDIEGGEKALFDSNDIALKSAKAIFAELHDRIVPGCTDSFQKFNVGRKISKPGREKYLAIG